MNTNIIMFVVLIILTLMMTYKNVQRMKEYKKDKAYIDLYTKVLRGEEGVSEELNKYIETESDSCLNTKARIVRAYNDLLNEKNPSEELKDIDIKNIYYVNDAFSSEKAKLNSEIFVWLTLMLSKARCLSMIDLMNELYSKVSAYEEDLKVLVEYQVFKSAYTSLLEKGTDGIEFLKQLLSGNYSEYVYDKNLIGIYKKIACCLLVFTGEPIDESDEAMLPKFTGTLVGNRFTRDLEIYDKYASKEETPVEANTTEDNKEETENDNEIKESQEVEDTDEEKTVEGEDSNKEETIEEKVNDVKSSVEEKVEEAKEDVKESLEDAKEEVETKTEEIKEEIEPKVEEVKEELEEKAEEVKEDLEAKEASIKKAEDELLASSGHFGDDK